MLNKTVITDSVITSEHNYDKKSNLSDPSSSSILPPQKPRSLPPMLSVDDFHFDYFESKFVNDNENYDDHEDVVLKIPIAVFPARTIRSPHERPGPYLRKKYSYKIFT